MMGSPLALWSCFLLLYRLTLFTLLPSYGSATIVNDSHQLQHLRRTLDSSLFIPGTSGILLVHRDSEDGSRLEYRNSDMDLIYHERSFPLSRRSFAIEQGDSDVVVIADPKTGLVSRANRDFPDHIGRTNPRSITYDEQDGIIMWLEGESGNSMFAISVFNKEIGEYGSTEDAPLNVDQCRNATLAAAMRLEDEKLIVVPIICDDQLHLVKVVIPLPPFNRDGTISVQATSTKVNSNLPLTHATAIAVDRDNLGVFVSRTNGRNLCQVENLKVDVRQDDSDKILLARDVIFDCTNEAPLYHMRGLTYHDEYLYVSSFTPGALRYFSNSIGRLHLPQGVVRSMPEMQILINRRNAELINPELFSPGFLHIKRQIRGAHHLYWLDLLDGRISRMYFKVGPNENRPRIFVEPVEGHSCPAAVALLAPNTTAGEAVPTLYWSDHGKNAIWKDSMEFTVDWNTTESTLIAKTASQPTALFVEPTHRMLYWAEPESETIIAYSLDLGHIITNMTYRLDPEPTPSRLNSIAYLPKTDRIYVTDSYPTHRRILSWQAPNTKSYSPQTSGTQEVWRATPEHNFVPKALVGDPRHSILYVSDANAPTIYALYLNPTVPHHGDNVNSPARPMHHDNPLMATTTTTTTMPPALSNYSSDVFLSDPLNGGILPAAESVSYDEPLPPTTQRLVDELNAAYKSHRSNFTRRFLLAGERMREETEDENDGIAMRVFYKAEDNLSEPIQQMWLNEGNLHWAEVRSKGEGLIETTLKYKRTLQTNNPKNSLNANAAYVFSRSTNKSLVLTAQMFDVHEGMLPKNAWELAGYFLSGLAIIFMAIVGFCFCCKSRNMYEELDEKDPLREIPDVVPEKPYQDGRSALMSPTSE